jgi:hypothetical protein
MHVTLALPTVVPLFHLGDAELYNSCVEDLLASSNQLCAHDKMLGGCRLEFSHLPDAPNQPLVSEHWKMERSGRQYDLLVVSADLSSFSALLRSELESDGRARTERQVSDLISSYGVQSLQFEVNNLLLLANILRPGAVSVVPGYGFVDGAYREDTSAFAAEEWYRATRAAAKYKWPHFQPLGIRDAWSWLASTRCFEDRIARGRVGRALGALSYIAPEHYQSESSLNLAWALLGLEALYCTGNVGLREQLIAKTELVLGPRPENKKAFGAMYDFRSRLLHGDMDLPLRYSGLDAVPGFERHFEDLGDYEGIGLSALVATIQVMIKNQWSSLSFRYELEGVQVFPPTAA